MVKQEITYVITNEIFTKCVYISSDAVMKTVAKRTAMAYYRCELQSLNPNSRSFTHDKNKMIYKMEMFESKYGRDIREIMNYRRSALNGRIRKQYEGDLFGKTCFVHMFIFMHTLTFFYFIHLNQYSHVEKHLLP